MGGLSISHLLIVLIVVLLLFGAGRVSEIGKGLGEGIRNFKKGLRDDEDEAGHRISVKRKDDDDAEAPRLTPGKKRVIQIEVDDDEDEAEIRRRLQTRKRADDDKA